MLQNGISLCCPDLHFLITGPVNYLSVRLPAVCGFFAGRRLFASLPVFITLFVFSYCSVGVRVPASPGGGVSVFPRGPLAHENVGRCPWWARCALRAGKQGWLSEWWTERSPAVGGAWVQILPSPLTAGWGWVGLSFWAQFIPY
jgi:hypothetical protein